MLSQEMPVDSRVRVEVKGLVVDPATNVPMVVLRAIDGDSFVLPIWVGVFEANAIALQLEHIETPRPMTHDLLRDAIHRLGASIVEVVVTDVRDSTFYATVLLRRHDGHAVSVDARPSDALALALRAAAPVFVDRSVIDKAQAFDPGSEDPEKLREWFEGILTD
jgi:bifunctional DNase/RNase